MIISNNDTKHIKSSENCIAFHISMNYTADCDS